MSSCTMIQKAAYFYGGFSSDYDKCTDDLFLITSLEDGEVPNVTLIGGSQAIEESYWSEDELQMNGCLVQKGALPG